MELARRVPPAPAALVRPRWPTLALFTAATFVGATLVFAIQPMVAKMLLPSFGGASSVWAVSLVFFQAILLAGYAFAHLTLTRLGVRRQTLVQLVLIAAPVAVLPIAVRTDVSGDRMPTLALLAALATAAALPFFAVTTASPVLQRWFSESGHRSGRDPYFLYAAGNTGSLLGLLLYPLVLERTLSLEEQARAWALGYAAFVVLTALCAWRVHAAPRVERQETAERSSPLAWRTRLRWVGLAAVATSLMVGTTTHLSTDVASVPLLWVLPLALYLLTFVVAFARRPPITVRTLSRVTVATSVAAIASVLPITHLPIWVLVLIHSANLFALALLVHLRLAGARPGADRLTEFYLLLSIGGVCGGAFNALLAPVVFPTVAEYPLAIVLALLVRPGARGAVRGASFLRRQADLLLPFALFLGVLVGATVAAGLGISVHVVLAAAAALLLAFAHRPLRFAAGAAGLLALAALPAQSLYSERTFYGVLTVKEKGSHHQFVHGRTMHAVEDFSPGRVGEPLSYYSRGGPLGDVFAELGHDLDDVAFIGLGAGVAAAYGRPDDRFTFFEIDPAVVRIASDRNLFTYVSDSRAEIEMVVGDGRLEIARPGRGPYDAIVLDAFSSDAIPMHLLTTDAVELYLEKLRPNGVLAFHISNQYLRLQPLVAGIAKRLELAGLSRQHRVSARADAAGITHSDWVVVSRNSASLRPLAERGWRPLPRSGHLPVWTDESSNVLDVVSWLR